MPFAAAIALTIFSRILLVSSQNLTSEARLIERIDCQLANLYQQPNASNAYEIPAIEALTSSAPDLSLARSPTQKWALTAVLGQSTDIYSADDPPILERAIFLDTSSTLKNSSTAVDLGISGCNLVFSLASSRGQNDDNGDCTSVFDDECVNDIKGQALVQAQSIAAGGLGNLTLSEACYQMSLAVTSGPESCSEYKEGESNFIGNGVLQYSGMHTATKLLSTSYRTSIGMNEA